MKFSVFELKTNVTLTFKQVYSADEYKCSQDVVVTCFFLDTARNVLDYIELIHQILKPGGHWINLGPLLYHFADIPGELCIEPPYEIGEFSIDSVNYLFDSIMYNVSFCS